MGLLLLLNLLQALNAWAQIRSSSLRLRAKQKHDASGAGWVVQDKDLRAQRKQLEFMWRGSKSYGSQADIWAHAMGRGTYVHPDGWNMGKLSGHGAQAEQLMVGAISSLLGRWWLQKRVFETDADFMLIQP